MITQEELKVLERYKDGREVDPEDRSYIDRFLSIGLVRTGFGVDEAKKIKYQTAVVSKKGKRVLGQENIFNKPLLRWLHGWFHSL